MKYIHMRRPFYQTLSNGQHRFVPDNVGGVTIAYRETEQGIKWAVAHFKDCENYVKAKGRAKAGGKTHSRKWAYSFDGTPKAFFHHILDSFEKEGYGCYSKRSRSFLSR